MRSASSSTARGHRRLLAALSALLLALLASPAAARRAGGGFGGGFGRASSRPVSSGYGYRPTFTPAAGAAPKATPAAAGRPLGAGAASSAVPMAGGAAGAMRARTRTPLIVPFALGAGSGLLVSSALRSGQRCGDGRLECYRDACSQALSSCSAARGARLARAPCPPGFGECWAAGPEGAAGGQEAAFVCNGRANPVGPSDVQATCMGGEEEDGGAGGGAGGAVASASGRGGRAAAGGLAVTLAAAMLAVLA